MSKELNLKFLKDPVQFARDTPVVAPGHATQKGVMKTFQDVPDHLLGVPGKLRIIAGDLTDKQCYAELTISHENVKSKLEQGWVAMYYLPWLADHTVRTTLRPRSETTREGKLKEGNRAVPKLGKIEGQNADDPDIFFTAAVDGCMVTVSGPPDEPVVFHANRMSLDTNTELGSAQDERVTRMTQDVKTFMETRPKATRLAQLGSSPPKAATAELYMPFTRKGELDVNREHVVPEKEKHKISKQLGTIFGVRDKGTWRFYYERLLKFDRFLWEMGTVYDKEWNPIEAMSWDFKGPGYKLDCPLTEFWPDGSGHVLFG